MPDGVVHALSVMTLSNPIRLVTSGSANTRPMVRLNKNLENRLAGRGSRWTNSGEMIGSKMKKLNTQISPSVNSEAMMRPLRPARRNAGSHTVVAKANAITNDNPM